MFLCNNNDKSNVLSIGIQKLRNSFETYGIPTVGKFLDLYTI